MFSLYSSKKMRIDFVIVTLVSDDQFYDYDLNCTWILNADQGYYITLEIEHFMVEYSNDTLHFHNFSKKVYHLAYLG